jgi:YggT family protein
MGSDIAMLLINTVVSIYLLLVLLRFMLQLAKADFYNPISQFIVKATNPILIPMRRAIPGFGGIDVSSLLLAIIVQLIGVVLVMLLTGSGIDPLKVVIWSVLLVVGLVLNIYFWGLIIIVISSWIAPNSYNPALVLVSQILDPVVKPVRKMMPDMGGLDLSPIVIFITIQILKIALNHAMVAAHLPPVLATFV